MAYERITEEKLAMYQHIFQAIKKLEPGESILFEEKDFTLARRLRSLIYAYLHSIGVKSYFKVKELPKGLVVSRIPTFDQTKISSPFRQTVIRQNLLDEIASECFDLANPSAHIDEQVKSNRISLEEASILRKDLKKFLGTSLHRNPFLPENPKNKGDK